MPTAPDPSSCQSVGVFHTYSEVIINRTRVLQHIALGLWASLPFRAWVRRSRLQAMRQRLCPTLDCWISRRPCSGCTPTRRLLGQVMKGGSLDTSAYAQPHCLCARRSCACLVDWSICWRLLRSIPAHVACVVPRVSSCHAPVTGCTCKHSRRRPRNSHRDRHEIGVLCILGRPRTNCLLARCPCSITCQRSPCPGDVFAIQRTQDIPRQL